jgi:CHAD domain-containing protein
MSSATSQLRLDEAGTQGARRIARRQVKSALDMLGRKTAADRSVHTARKELKKARATLRLLRGALGSPEYKKENAALRDAARPLSEVRDGQVLLEALKSLVKHYGAPASALPLARFERVLSRRSKEMRDKVLGTAAPLEGARKMLRAVRARSEHWHVGRHGWSVLGTGLKRTYSQARRAFTRALARPTNESLHEWRKQTQYFRHQLQLFEPLWPGPVAKLTQEVHKLSGLLGDDHDLAVLRDRAMEAGAVFPTAAKHQALIVLIDRCRKQLQEKAFKLGQHLYEEKPAAFAGRLEKRWREWRKA